jgi:hypothetical protein
MHACTLTFVGLTSDFHLREREEDVIDADDDLNVFRGAVCGPNANFRRHAPEVTHLSATTAPQILRQLCESRQVNSLGLCSENAKCHECVHARLCDCKARQSADS